jgi:hypothetical protein
MTVAACGAEKTCLKNNHENPFPSILKNERPTKLIEGESGSGCCESSQLTFPTEHFSERSSLDFMLNKITISYACVQF